MINIGIDSVAHATDLGGIGLGFGATPNKFPLVDRNINFRLLNRLWPGYEKFMLVEQQVFEQEGVRSHWGHLDSSQILTTVTRDDFRNNRGALTIANAWFEAAANVVYTPLGNDDSNTGCGNCDSPLSGILTSSTGGITEVCQGLAVADFSQLVWSVAQPSRIALLTNDKCLGWCAATLGAYQLEKSFEKHSLVKNVQKKNY